MSNHYSQKLPAERMGDIDLFHFDDDCISFDDFSSDNGFRSWSARTFMRMLDYESYSTFKKAINKAISACAALNIDITENFVQENRIIDGKHVQDFRLSRFACYLTAMNGDAKKPAVARAQAYFATLAEAFRKYIQDADDVERVLIREEVSDNEKSLNSTARNAGVVTYAFFQNQGYRGMYNMNLSDLKVRKEIPVNRTALDFMGKEELAANLFRITQTEAKINNDAIFGQQALEGVAFQVGYRVRTTMYDLSGTRPEDLASAQDIKKVRTNLKATQRGLRKVDRLPRN